MVSDTVAFLVILCFNLLRGIQYHYLVTAIIKSPFVFQGILSKKCFGAENSYMGFMGNGFSSDSASRCERFTRSKQICSEDLCLGVMQPSCIVLYSLCLWFS